MSFYKLYQEVINKDLCTDCGACALVCPKNVIEYKETKKGYEPVLVGECIGENCTMCSDACPGAFIPRTKIEKTILGRERKKHSIEDTQGVLEEIYIGQWNEEKILQEAGSGGFVTGLLTYALEKKLIDGAVVSMPHSEYPWMSEPKVATTKEEIILAAGSRYDSYPHLLGIQKALDKGLKRIAIVTLPCHTHAIRKMQLEKKYKKYTDIIEYVIGLWCVCNFTRAGIEFLMKKRFGVDLKEIESMHYRKRPFPGTVTVKTKNNEIKKEGFVTRHVYHRLSSSFMQDACRQCIDAQCDLADVSFGDPWGHEIDKEALETGIGFSTALVRNKKADDLIKKAYEDGMFNYLKKLNNDETDFLPKTGAVITKCFGHKVSIDERKKHGQAVRVVE